MRVRNGMEKVGRDRTVRVCLTVLTEDLVLFPLDKRGPLKHFEQAGAMVRFLF